MDRDLRFLIKFLAALVAMVCGISVLLGANLDAVKVLAVGVLFAAIAALL